MFSEFVALWVRAFEILGFIASTFVLWAPFVLVPLAVYLYRQYKQRRYILNIKWALLEIRIPKDIKKTPLAMEVVLSAMHQPASGTWYDRLKTGRVPLWFSLEMLATGGTVRFFIRTPVEFKPLLQAEIYAQYPTVEILEAEDYVFDADYHPEHKDSWQLFGTEYQLVKPDPYPIKTYVDFGLDREGVKEEERTDPIATDLEILGQVRRDERYWIQFIVRATRKRFRKKKRKWWEKLLYTDWREEGQELIREIMERAGAEIKPEGGFVMKNLSPVDEQVIKAIERNITKLGFDVGIRAVYLAKNELRGEIIKMMMSYFKQYGSNVLNGLAPTNVTGFDYPWQDMFGRKEKLLKREMLDAYRRRAYFYPPYRRKSYVFNTEELATLYHFPSQIVEAPSIERIESRKGEPPSNLPI